MKKFYLVVMALAIFASMVISPADPAAAQSCDYTVKAGDTSSAIAAAKGITLGQLVAANPGLNTRWIGIGQTLNVCPNVVPTVRTTSFTADPGPSPARQVYRAVNSWAERECVAYELYLETTVCIQWSTGTLVIPYNRR
jgi:spore germination protein YaaH